MHGIEGLERWRLVVWGGLSLLLAVEFFLDRFLTGDKGSGTLRRLALAAIPFLMLPFGHAWLDLSQWPPPPHLYVLRQAQMVFGILWISHLLFYLMLTGRKAAALGRFRPAWVFGLLGLYLFGGTSVQTLQASPTGDEPHYLMVMESLVQDGDLDLRNNYAREDWRKFHGRSELKPQDEEPLDAQGRRISRHPVGTSILAMPAYLIGGRFGVAALFSLAGAATVFFVLLALEAMGFLRETIARVGWVALVSSPLWMFSGNIFPEIPAALFWAGALWAASRERWSLSGFLACSTLWLHSRNGFALLGIGAVWIILCLIRGDCRPRAWQWGWGGAFPVMALIVFQRLLFESWNPGVVYGTRIEGGFGPGYLPAQILGHLTDQESGLFIYYPIFLVVPAGVAAAFRFLRPGAPFLAGALGAALTGLGCYFYLGGPPPTRFLAALTPWFLLSSAFALRSVEKNPVFLRGWTVLSALGCCITFPLVAIPWMRYSQSGEAWIWQLVRHLTGLPLPAFLPSFYMEPVPVRSYVLALLWVGASIGIARGILSAAGRSGKGSE